MISNPIVGKNCWNACQEYRVLVEVRKYFLKQHDLTPICKYLRRFGNTSYRSKLHESEFTKMQIQQFSKTISMFRKRLYDMNEVYLNEVSNSISSWVF